MGADQDHRLIFSCQAGSALQRQRGFSAARLSGDAAQGPFEPSPAQKLVQRGDSRRQERIEALPEGIRKRACVDHGGNIYHTYVWYQEGDEKNMGILTSIQKKILIFIEDEIAQAGAPPTLRTICWATTAPPPRARPSTSRAGRDGAATMASCARCSTRSSPAPSTPCSSAESIRCTTFPAASGAGCNTPTGTSTSSSTGSRPSEMASAPMQPQESCCGTAAVESPGVRHHRSSRL